MNKYIKTILLSTALLCFGAGSASAAQFSDAKAVQSLAPGSWRRSFRNMT